QAATLSRPGRGVSRLVRHASGIVPAMLAIVSLAQAQDVSRYASWKANDTVFSGNSHGSLLNPTGNAWNYYHQAGRDESGTIISQLTPSLWTGLSFSSANDNFYVYEPGGGRNRGRAEINANGLSTAWDVTSGTSPINSFPTTRTF
ncbi:MAG: hypothetical protein LBK99_13380, partial [Opitutaceae bacterium]|nr:hypothetical protein [Opitutaceae bacterium]